MIPLKVYRVYADGRPDELVRGVDMVGTPLTVFSKILATDDRPGVFNGVCGAESGWVPVSAVSPAVLISEIEIEKKPKSMERPPVLAAPVVAPPPAKATPAGAAASASDVLLEALADELARSADSLRLEGLASPYYVAYRVNDGVVVQIEASFGEVVVRDRSRSRTLQTEIRVGSRESDNSNFFDPTLAFRGAGGSLALDDRYSAIRWQLWRATDDRYKQAAEALARKAAALRGKVTPDTLPDFSEAAPQVLIRPPASLVLDDAAWVELARRASAVFRGYPAVEDSRVGVLARVRNRYFASTEGSRIRVPEPHYAVLVTAKARGAGGRSVQDYRLFVARSAAGLPGLPALAAAARELAAELTARAAAEVPTSYTGPVLFEGRAAAQFFQLLLGRHLSGTPAPVMASQFAQMAPGEKRLESLLGRRILPRGFAVRDDPTLEEYGGGALAGHYLADDEGVAPQRVALVEDGMLEAFLMSRAPSNSARRSTGHGRSESPIGEPRATMGNLVIEAAQVLNAPELKAELVRRVREEGLEYGVLVSGLADPELLPADAGTFFFVGGPTARQAELPPPTAALKVYADGREEPIQGVEFAEASVRSLRDIVAAGGPPVLYNLLHEGSPPIDSPFFRFSGSGPGKLRWPAVPSSIVAPAVLVEELELRKTEAKEKPPLLGHPYFQRRN